MSYATYLASYAPQQPERPNVVGYLFNNGGLSNQKMALAGLLLAAVAQNATINLPYIHIKDQRNAEEWLACFGDVFETVPLKRFAERYRVGVEWKIPSGERGGWPYFFVFGEHLNVGSKPAVVRTLLEALGSITPRIASSPALTSLRDFVFASLGIEICIQLRIERDWQDHAAGLLPKVEGKDDIAIGFEEILRRTANTFPHLRAAYVTADEQSMPVPKEQICAVSQERFGIRLIWKSDLINIADFNPLDLSLIDFEIARCSPRFVGLSFSTFTNLLCLEAFAASRRPVTGHFIYNLPGDIVHERRDNGLALASADAVVSNWSDRLWAADGASL